MNKWFLRLYSLLLRFFCREQLAWWSSWELHWSWTLMASGAACPAPFLKTSRSELTCITVPRFLYVHHNSIRMARSYPKNFLKTAKNFLKTSRSEVTCTTDLWLMYVHHSPIRHCTPANLKVGIAYSVLNTEATLGLEGFTSFFCHWLIHMICNPIYVARTTML